MAVVNMRYPLKEAQARQNKQALAVYLLGFAIIMAAAIPLNWAPVLLACTALIALSAAISGAFLLGAGLLLKLCLGGFRGQV